MPAAPTRRLLARRQPYSELDVANRAISFRVRNSEQVNFGNSITGHFRTTMARQAWRPMCRRVSVPVLVLLLAIFTCLQCGGGRDQTPAAIPPAAGVPRFGLVALVMLENKSFSNVIGSPAMPYLNSLADRYGLATNYFANTHPSIGNYFMVTTGEIVTNDSNFTGTITADNLVRRMANAGVTWRVYAESLPSVGYTGPNVYPYAKRHNPFAYFSDVVESDLQRNNLVPLSQFADDLAVGNLPQYLYLLPNEQNNAHDCPEGMTTCTVEDKLAAADRWLEANVAPLIASPAFQSDGLLIINWDESEPDDLENGGGRVALVLVSSKVKQGHRSVTVYQHQSTLRLMLQTLGINTFPGTAASAPDMHEFFLSP